MKLVSVSALEGTAVTFFEVFESQLIRSAKKIIIKMNGVFIANVL